MDNNNLVVTLYIFDSQGKKRQAQPTFGSNSVATITEASGIEILHAVQVLTNYFNIGVKLTTKD